MLKSIIKKILPRWMTNWLIEIKHLNCKKLSIYDVYVNYVFNKKGIEIGGPSLIFKTSLPLYEKIKGLDGVNFSNATVWEGQVNQGLTYNFFRNRKGLQFVSEATDLVHIADDSYEFLLSSNCLEHVANPLKALMEWRRVIKQGSAIVLILPNKISNFDHRRPVTSFEHLLEDFNNNISEYDLTHLDEIIRLHDICMDPPARNIENFKKRSLDNFQNRTLHHHVFDLEVINKMLVFCKFQVVHQYETSTDFFSLAIKKQ